MSEVKAKRNEKANMIEFKGKLSNECKSFIVHNHQLVHTGIAIFGTAPFIVISSIMAAQVHFSFLIFTLGLVCVIIAAYFVKPKGEPLENLLTYRIRIIDKSVIMDGTKSYREYKIEDVTKVIDFGNFYEIVFSFPYISFLRVCQKNLITQGSIEEFENLFEGLIVKRKFKYKPKDKK